MNHKVTSRMRQSKVLRDFVTESSIASDKLVLPIFIKEKGELEKSKWGGMERIPLSALEGYISSLVESGLKSLLLFGLPSHKDAVGSGAYSRDGVVQQAIKILRSSYPSLIIITDVCLCQYTDHGHCGFFKDGLIERGKTLELLSRVALSHAEAGANIVAPSAMADGQVKAIRAALDTSSFENVAIMSYSAKYASSLYAPFREVASSAPLYGDRSSYQMDYRNKREAVSEAEEDVREGADIVMVKPALTSLDVISELRRLLLCPIAAYQVSGEYVMIKSYCDCTGVDERTVILETLSVIRRAGADIIISYFTPRLISLLKEGMS